MRMRKSEKEAEGAGAYQAKNCQQAVAVEAVARNHLPRHPSWAEAAEAHFHQTLETTLDVIGQLQLEKDPAKVPNHGQAG